MYIVPPYSASDSTANIEDGLWFFCAKATLDEQAWESKGSISPFVHCNVFAKGSMLHYCFLCLDFAAMSSAVQKNIAFRVPQRHSFHGNTVN